MQSVLSARAAASAVVWVESTGSAVRVEVGVAVFYAHRQLAIYL
jgi:hypothetical protein